jgi:rhodanese-related sulfurtransferase
MAGIRGIQSLDRDPGRCPTWQDRAMADSVTRTSPLFEHVASADEAARHFRGRLAFETDVSDVHAALDVDDRGFVLIDSRSDAAWAQGHVPGAVHLPTREIRERAAELVAPGTPVVVYCWGPGCNGATRAALEFALLGHPVKEMLGGFEYWAREGFDVETAAGVTQPAPDPLTNVVPEGGPVIACAC